MKAYSEWTTEELLAQERMNFAAHMAIMFMFLKERQIGIDDFVHYIGETVLPGWKEEVHSKQDFIDGILLNVRANGGEVLSIEDASAGEVKIVVNDILNSSMMRDMGATEYMGSALWDKFYIIANGLGYGFKWAKNSDGNHELRVSENEYA
jgi:hypothetical protein